MVSLEVSYTSLPVEPPPPDISSLDDNLIFQILTRLGNPRSVFRCRAVCKRWNSLISAAYFLPKFLHQLATQPSAAADADEIPLLGPESHRETLGFLPIPDDLRCQFRVLASCGDLILAGMMTPPQGTVGRWFFVCNPFTKQWVSLPLAPFTGRRGGEDPAIQYSEKIMVGFVCQPCYSYCDSEDQVSIDSQFKFRVVLVYDAGGKLWLERFCSELGKWVDGVTRNALGEDEVIPSYNHITLPSFDRKLLWWNDTQSLMEIYDPFNNGDKLFRFDYSSTFAIAGSPQSAVCRLDIAVSQGALHLILARGNADSLDRLTVWRWEEESNYWVPVNDVSLTSVWVEYSLQEKMRMEVKGLLGIHPSNPDVVYLAYGNGLIACYVAVCCNLKSGKLELFGEDSQQVVHSMFCWGVFQPEISIWPTPVPLPSNYESVSIDEDSGYGIHKIVAHSSMLGSGGGGGGDESDSSSGQMFDSSSYNARRVEEASEEGGVGDDHEELNPSPPEQTEQKGDDIDGGALTAEGSTGFRDRVKRILGMIFMKMVGGRGRRYC